MFLRIFFQYRLVDLNYVYKMHVILSIQFSFLKHIKNFSVISPLLFPRFSLPLPIQFLHLERKQTILYHHPQREGQQPEKHKFADSEEQAGSYHRPVGIG